MVKFFNSDSPPPSPRQIALHFRLVGWAGFWLQAFLGFIPILVMLSFVFFAPAKPAGTSWAVTIALICLVISLFSIYWCFRYTRLAREIEDPESRPARSQVLRDLTIGLVANLTSTVGAVLIALWQTGSLTTRILSLPQGATKVAPVQTGTLITQGAAITASNLITLQAMINLIAAGLVGMIVALWLLYRVGAFQTRR